MYDYRQIYIFLQDKYYGDVVREIKRMKMMMHTADRLYAVTSPRHE